MLRLTDFAQICRLCLKKHEENCVNLFTVVENGEEVSDCRTVADVVKLHCRIEVRVPSQKREAPFFSNF